MVSSGFSFHSLAQATHTRQNHDVTLYVFSGTPDRRTSDAVTGGANENWFVDLSSVLLLVLFRDSDSSMSPKLAKRC